MSLQACCGSFHPDSDGALEAFSKSVRKGAGQGHRSRADGRAYPGMEAEDAGHWVLPPGSDLLVLEKAPETTIYKCPG